MIAQISLSPVDRTQLGAAWNTMHGEFHQLVRSIPPAAFRRRTLDTRWTIAEILTHMFGIHQHFSQGRSSV